MRTLFQLLIAGAFLLRAGAAQPSHTQASLLLSANTAQPGETITAGIRLRMDPHWHTYWRNSGASGIPTTIQWDLPAGITPGAAEWPIPDRFPPDDLVTYGYEDEVVLLVPLKLDAGLAAGSRELNAAVSWLECNELCLPGKARVHATLIVGPEHQPSADAGLIESWRQKLPVYDSQIPARAWWENATQPDLRPMVIEWPAAVSGGSVDFYSYGNADWEVQGAVERLESNAGMVRIRKQVKKFAGDWPAQASGLLVQINGTNRQAFEVTLRISASAPAAGHGAASAPAPLDSGNAPAPRSLWKNLGAAFLGGLILNIMPCVLPVIALKILGFVGEARSDKRRVRLLGLVYAAGVLVSFAALAGIGIGIKAAGGAVAWGLQFSNPYFLIAMCVLLTLIALNLFGVFEVTLGANALGAASALASKHGVAGAFFNGLLATLLATSCTAPFLGGALGYALAQSPGVILLIMLFAGAGLASPYVLLSWEPAWLRFIPKPGPWMERFKVAMGFPMLAAAIWLCSLLTSFYGDRAWALAIFLIFVGVAAWIFGQFVQRGARHRGFAAIIALGLLGAGYAYALENQLHWREPLPPGSPRTVASSQSPEGGFWEPWSPEAVAHAQQEGKPVLVDFTAKWCLTCQKNVKPVLESTAVQDKLNSLGAARFLADYTRFPEDITLELKHYGRAGVPMVLVFPGKAGAPPLVLPELLTQGTVLDALEKVSGQAM